MKKGKILAGLLAALLILSIVPAGALAESVWENGTVRAIVSSTAVATKRLPVVFTYDQGFVDWFGSVFLSNQSVSTWLNPLTEGNKLVLAFGGEAERGAVISEAQKSLITGYFANKHFSEVDIYLTNLTPNDPKAITLQDDGISYPDLSAWKNVNNKLLADKSYFYFGLKGPDNYPYQPATYYSSISNLIGVFGENTRVNVYLSNEIDSYVTKPVETELSYKTILFGSRSGTQNVDFGKKKVSDAEMKHGVPNYEFFVTGSSNSDFLLDNLGRRLYRDHDFTSAIPSAKITPVTVDVTFYRAVVAYAILNRTSNADFAAEVASWQPLNTDTGNELVPDPPVAIDQGTTFSRSSVSYTLGNYVFNDWTNVGVTVGGGTNFAIGASTHINDVTVEKGGYLNLSQVNYSILNSLFTKWIDNLTLKEGSTIDFPVGTTDAIAAKWLGNAISSIGFTIRVNGKTINPKPNAITVTPKYGIYQPVSGVPSYYAFQGTAAYFEIRLASLKDWSEYQGLYAYVKGNSKEATKFASRELPWISLENNTQAVPTFNWANPKAAAIANSDGTYSYFVPLFIAPDEDSQAITVAFDAVKTDSFWASEHEGAFTFSVKSLPKLAKAAISPEKATVAKGASQAFLTQVYEEDGSFLQYRHNSAWSVTGAKSASTKIDQNGVLTVGSDETASTLVVNVTTSVWDIYQNLFYATGDGKNFTTASPLTLTASAVVTVAGGAVPPAPASIKIGASHASPTSVSLSWNAVAGATGYNLYQASSSAGSYQLVAANTQSLSATATGLATGSYYWFKAAAVDAAGEIASSDPIQVRARPLRPASISAAAGSKTGSVKVTWGSVAECGGYAVYVSTSRTGAYTLKSVVSGSGSLSAQISGLKSGATYYFKVASYVQVGPAKVPSVYTGVVSAKAK